MTQEYDVDFKDLIEKMLSQDASLRPSLKDVMEHPYMLGLIANKVEVENYLLWTNFIV